MLNEKYKTSETKVEEADHLLRLNTYLTKGLSSVPRVHNRKLVTACNFITTGHSSASTGACIYMCECMHACVCTCAYTHRDTHKDASDRTMQ